MSGESEIVGIEHPELPGDLKAGAFIQFEGAGGGEVSDSGETASDVREIERSSGRRVIESLVRINYGDGELEISGKENEKPIGFYDHRPLHVSISHTGRMVAGVISKKRNLGIDLERVNRSVRSELGNRIINTLEVPLIRSIPVIQLWTVKEAALKWYGTGLRLSMNRVRVLNRNDACFSVLIENSFPVKVCSFQFKHHWVSIAYDP